jgi:hypothetical protein
MTAHRRCLHNIHGYVGDDVNNSPHSPDVILEMGKFQITTQLEFLGDGEEKVMVKTKRKSWSLLPVSPEGHTYRY